VSTNPNSFLLASTSESRIALIFSRSATGVSGFIFLSWSASRRPASVYFDCLSMHLEADELYDLPGPHTSRHFPALLSHVVPVAHPFDLFDDDGLPDEGVPGVVPDFGRHFICFSSHVLPSAHPPFFGAAAVVVPATTGVLGARHIFLPESHVVPSPHLPFGLT
jgi:hypothetical protein